MEYKETVLSRETILNAVWDYDYAGDMRTVDTLVKQIRKKLGDDCNYIHSIYNDAEYRNKEMCKVAMIRRDFYENKITFEEALKRASFDE